MSSRNLRDRERSPQPQKSLPFRRALSSPKPYALSPKISNEDDDTVGPLGLNLLSDPPQALTELIFVHGLGGGSRKTWSKFASEDFFWPKSWLSNDPDFEHARIWSFGYDSAYSKNKSDVLNIDDFGKALVGALSSSKWLQVGATPIIFIGHSMGGLVIKNAYLLARRDASLSTFCDRFFAICFLATPHRGSDWAQTLSRILQFANRSRAYVGDLKRDSQIIQSINTDFSQYQSDVIIKSFYETQKLSLGLVKALIVAKDSATLGYDGEQQFPMYADHRSICKFGSKLDHNFKVFRDVLSNLVADATLVRQQSETKITRGHVDEIRHYLGISEDWDQDLVASEDLRLPGTCSWLTQRPYYQSWIDFTSGGPPVLWIKGKPASGKSVLSGYIINQLEQQQTDFSYFFFKHGEVQKSRLSSCLRSIAFQMAARHPAIRTSVLQMLESDIVFDFNDERNIWRKLFVSCIFKTQFSQHFWVIDGLDECADSVERLSNVLLRIDPSLPLRILITSRESADLERIISAMGIKRCVTPLLSPSDTASDIQLLLQDRADSLMAGDQDSRDKLTSNILEKSNGSFLWTRLVLDELADAFAPEDIRQILENVPQGMRDLYLRSLQSMSRGLSQTSRVKNLAKGILDWTMCSVRTLTLEELNDALKFDMGTDFANLRATVGTLCGNFLFIDKFGKIQLVHSTAREFILDPSIDSEFAVDTSKANTRIALSCLRYLTSDQMRPPRTRRSSSRAPVLDRRSKISQYASHAFSYHLARSDPSSRQLLELAHQFLKLNVLSWIEVTFQTQGATALVRAAKNLSRYSDNVAAQASPLHPSIHALRTWSTDIVRIAAKFSSLLSLSPSAIYSLVAPFCPKNSLITQISVSNSQLLVSGVANDAWDDRLACLDFHDDEICAMCAGDEFLAIGLRSGMVKLYHATSLQEYRRLDNMEPPKFVDFKPNSNLLVTCGQRKIRLWNFQEGHLLKDFSAPRRPLCVIIDNDTDQLLVASTANILSSWSLPNGLQNEDRPWHELQNHQPVRPFRSPCAISISLGHQMMAVAYRGQPITLWDLRDDEYYGNCGKKLPSGAVGPYWVLDLVFNPNAGIELLAATYQDGDLVLFDPFNNNTLQRFRADCHTLKASPDGHLLASANGRGEITIYEFETLTPLYRVRTTTSDIKQLGFSHDNLRIMDCRHSHCNVWEPTALLRDRVVSSDYSSASSMSTIIVESTPKSPNNVKITAMAFAPKNQDYAFCGKADGSVVAFELQSGTQTHILYSHTVRSAVQIMNWWDEQNALLSVDASNSVYAWRIELSSAGNCKTDGLLFRARLDCGSSIVQLFTIEGTNNFIASTRETDFLCDTSGKQLKSRPCPDAPGIRIWVHHPLSQTHIICMGDSTARIYCSTTWDEIATVSTGDIMSNTQLKRIFLCADNSKFIAEYSELDSTLSTRAIRILDTESFKLDNTDDQSSLPQLHGTSTPMSLVTLPYYAVAKDISHVIGTSAGSTLVFLNKESFVCSVDLAGAALRKSYLRHFYIPYDWFSGTKDVICALNGAASSDSRDWNILLVRNSELGIIRGGFQFADEIFL